MKTPTINIQNNFSSTKKINQVTWSREVKEDELGRQLAILKRVILEQQEKASPRKPRPTPLSNRNFYEDKNV